MPPFVYFTSKFNGTNNPSDNYIQWNGLFLFCMLQKCILTGCGKAEDYIPGKRTWKDETEMLTGKTLERLAKFSTHQWILNSK